MLASNRFMLVTVYRDRKMDEVDQGEFAKVYETNVNLTRDDLEQRRNSFRFSDKQSTRSEDDESR